MENKKAMNKLGLKRYFPVAIIFAFFLVLGLYAEGRAQNLIRGAQINVSSLSDGAVVNEPLIKIEGVAKNARDFSINDREVAVSEDYDFSEKILLLPGYNIITLKGEDKFGKKTEEQIRVVYHPLVAENGGNIISVSLNNENEIKQ